MAALSINKNIPNLITILRIILVIPIIAIMICNSFGICYSFKIEHQTINISWNMIIALILFIIASISDWLDGYLSRKYHLVSDLGKILDPIADKVLVNSVLVIFAVQNKIFVVFVLIFIIRDVIVDALRMVSAKQNLVIAANIWGKLKTVLQMLAIIVMFILGTNLEQVAWWTWGIQNILIYLACITSVISGLIYIQRFIRTKKNEQNIIVK